MDLKVQYYCRLPWPGISKQMLKTMKLIAVILFATFIQVSARGYSQITLSEKNASLQKVFLEIQKQSGYDFVSTYETLKEAGNVTVNVRNVSLQKALEACLKDKPLTYVIIDKTVVVQPKKENYDNVNTNLIALETLPPPPVEIHGRVVNQQGQPLQNVSVLIAGTRIGTTTNSDGRFTLTAPDDKNVVLEISSIGYQTKKISVGKQTEINVTLELEVTGLNDIVVVGYGTQKKSSVTGAVDAISSKAIEGRPVTNTLAALQGTAANLIVQQTNFEPGQGQNLNIRGIGTLGDNTPLIVIDGITGGDVNLLNPNDIASVSVLKDAGAAAIYGSRSANGVILITTKKGRKNEKPAVSYSGIYGIQSPRITYKPVDAWENAYYKNVSLVNSGLAPSFTPDEILALKEKGNGDWRVKNILRDAPQQSHNVTIRGGGINNTYFISLGMFDQQSNFVGPNYGYKRYNARLNQSTDVGRLKVTTTLSYTKVMNKDHTSSTGNLMVDASRVPLYYNFQDSAGQYLTNPVSAELNPLAILKDGGYRQYNNDEIFGSLDAELSITKDLKLVGVAGGTVTQYNMFERQLPLSFYPGGSFGSDSYVGENNFKSLFTNMQSRLEYIKSLGLNNIQLMVGGANESYKGESSQIVERFTDPALGVPITGTLIDPGSTRNSIRGTNETSINSIFGRANYNFSDKYFFEFDFRYDGSSKFERAHRWGFFPSASLAWRVSQESFFKKFTNVISELKIRGSYGILGNQNVSAYQYQTTFFSYANAYGFNNNIVGGSGFSIGNPDLTWERASTKNVGIDATFARNFDVNFDYFDKVTRDILAPRDDVPKIFGSGFPDYNIAKVRDRGWELKLTYRHSGRVISQSFSANIADNLNDILQLSAGVKEYSPFQTEEYQLLRRVGQPVTVYYGYKVRGIYQNMEQVNDAKAYPRFANSIVGPGDLMFVDKNGDGVINDQDKFILGNPFPRYTFGFSYTLNWKNLDMSVFVQGVGKRDQMIRGEQVEPFHVGYGGTMYEHQTDFWTPTNPDAKWPRLAESGSAPNTNNFRTGSDIFLFDAAYARLKNVQLGYSLPQSALKKVGIQKVRIYVTGQNLLTLTNLSFLDPENTEFNNSTSPYGTGANSARSYFMPRFYGCGLDVTF